MGNYFGSSSASERRGRPEPMTDYKVSQIVRNENETRVLARFYRGSIRPATPEEREASPDTAEVYQREKAYAERVITFQGDVSDEDIRDYLNETLFLERGEEEVVHEQVPTRLMRVRPLRESVRSFV